MSKTAFIIIDIQNDYFEGGKFPLVGINEAAENVATLLHRIRKAKDEYLIINIRHEFPGDPKDAPFFGRGTEGSQINDKVKNLPGEIVLTKNEPNSFIGTNLELILEEKKISNLIVVGAMAHICVQGTVRAASEKGYKVTVISDAVATRDLTFGNITVPAKQVSAVVYATLAFAYSKLITTEEQIRLLK
ncbi:uncharacterized protein PRCAT00001465001 [Priceomyces carsonii]|uniref:uncharacterized protein n=1 Tax=Priceomyces carsonii TaxID=28549 RepID=UPI002EDAF51D|nr:unnamed protein product [Priceomyces carsonii]